MAAVDFSFTTIDARSSPIFQISGLSSASGRVGERRVKSLGTRLAVVSPVPSGGTPEGKVQDVFIFIID